MIAAATVEVEANRRAVEEHLAMLATRLDLVDRFLRASAGELASFPPDSVTPMVGALALAGSVNPVLDASRALAEATVQTPGGLEARGLVMRALGAWDDAQEEHEPLRDRASEIRAYLSVYAAVNADQGRAFIPSMVSRGGPATLSALRQDSKFVALLINKTHALGIYDYDLRIWQEVLDSASLVLSGR